MRNCFLFEGIGTGSLEGFTLQYIRDFDFRELSIYISKKCSYNLPRSIDIENSSDPFLRDQINTTLSNITAFHILKSQDLALDIIAGHSLGVYSAMYASGAIELKDTIFLVAEIHRILKERFEKEDFLSAIIIAPSIQDLRQALISKSNPAKPMYISNINTQKQSVVCGPTENVTALFSYFNDISKLKDKMLRLPYPVHTPYITAAKEELYELVSKIDLRDPSVPIINTVDQSIITTKHELSDYIVSNLYNPVHWLNTIEYHKENTVFWDIGLRYYISQLMFWIDKRIKCYNLNSKEKTLKLKGMHF